MAFSGFFVACGFVGSPTGKQNPQSLLGSVKWSEAPATGTPTTNVAPSAGSVAGDPAFQMRSAADCYVAIGPTPNPAASPRIFLPANETLTMYCQPGDKVAWTAA